VGESVPLGLNFTHGGGGGVEGRHEARIEALKEEE